MEHTLLETGGGTEVAGPGFADYEQYKNELDRELEQAAQSFVKIGFLLRVAEDTDILKGSGYRNVTEFAAAEYHLDKTQVSRFIKINIRFSEGGYSDRLKERYRRFGYAKLALMLNLPDAVNEELPDSLSKSEVQAVAEEIKAEAALSDLELAIEQAETAQALPEGQETSLRYRAAAQLCRERQGLFERMWYAQDAPECMQEVLAPLGEAVFMVRIPGTGRLMITVREQETAITVVRTGEKERCGTEEFALEIWKICRKGPTPEDAFRVEFGEGMEASAKELSGEGTGPAAAVGKKEQKPRKVSKVTKARVPEPAAARKGIPAAAVPEEQLPGQMEVYDYPELLPEERKEEDHGREGTERKERGSSGKDAAAAGICPKGREDGNGGEPDRISQHYEIPGTAEEDGCTEDPEGVRGTEEEKTWKDVLFELEAVKRKAMQCGQDHPGLETEALEELYQAAIRLAAAVHEIWRRSKKNEQEYHAG